MPTTIAATISISLVRSYLNHMHNKYLSRRHPCAGTKAGVEAGPLLEDEGFGRKRDGHCRNAAAAHVELHLLPQSRADLKVLGEEQLMRKYISFGGRLMICNIAARPTEETVCMNERQSPK